MIDEHDVREMLHRRANAISTIEVDAGKAARRARGRLLANGAVAILAAAAIAVATFTGVDAIRSAPIPANPTPSPAPDVLRANAEVLSFTGDPRWSHRTPGDLVAVNPETGEERVLVEDIDVVYSARWSADGRWVAYETLEQGDVGLWVVGASQEPRQVATGGQPYLLAPIALGWVVWSPTGAELAAINRSTLITIDPVSGETTNLASIDADERNAVLTPTPAWSPDGGRIAFGGRDWAVYSVDVRSGERSLLVRLPGEDQEEFHMIDEILWSPDGAHIAVMNGSRLYIMDADGSNVRVVVDEFDSMGVTWSAWSPDGTRLAFAEASQPDEEIRIRVAPMDGAAPAEIGSLPLAGCTYNLECGLTWSPDGSQIAFRKHKGEVTAFDANGAGEVGPIDELTYRSWDGGWYSCRKCN